MFSEEMLTEQPIYTHSLNISSYRLFAFIDRYGFIFNTFAVFLGREGPLFIEM